MPVRRSRIEVSQEHRNRIKTTLMIDKLQRFVMMERARDDDGKPTENIRDHKDYLSSSQIRAAEILLKKTLPDLAIIEIPATEGPTDVRLIPTEQLREIVATLASERAFGSRNGGDEPTGVH